jgi:hypothetical protein
MFIQSFIKICRFMSTVLIYELNQTLTAQQRGSKENTGFFQNPGKRKLIDKEYVISIKE